MIVRDLSAFLLVMCLAHFAAAQDIELDADLGVSYDLVAIGDEIKLSTGVQADAGFEVTGDVTLNVGDHVSVSIDKNGELSFSLSDGQLVEGVDLSAGFGVRFGGGCVHVSLEVGAEQEMVEFEGSGSANAVLAVRTEHGEGVLATLKASLGKEIQFCWVRDTNLVVSGSVLQDGKEFQRILIMRSINQPLTAENAHELLPLLRDSNAIEQLATDEVFAQKSAETFLFGVYCADQELKAPDEGLPLSLNYSLDDHIDSLVNVFFDDDRKVLIFPKNELQFFASLDSWLISQDRLWKLRAVHEFTNLSLASSIKTRFRIEEVENVSRVAYADFSLSQGLFAVVTAGSPWEYAPFNTTTFHRTGFTFDLQPIYLSDPARIDFTRNDRPELDFMRWEVEISPSIFRVTRESGWYLLVGKEYFDRYPDSNLIESTAEAMGLTADEVRNVVDKGKYLLVLMNDDFRDNEGFHFVELN